MKHAEALFGEGKDEGARDDKTLVPGGSGATRGMQQQLSYCLLVSGFSYPWSLKLRYLTTRESA